MSFRTLLAAAHRNIVLTPQEKQAVCCVVAALALGVATKFYRSTHPRPTRPVAVAKTQKRPFARVTPTPTDRPTDDDESDD